MPKVLEPTTSDINIKALLNPKERLAIWRKVRGMWKHRRPDPIKELAQMRREWERKLPSLH